MEKKRPHECCNIPENIDKYNEKPELEVEKCKVCGCKHYRLIAEKAEFKTIMR